MDWMKGVRAAFLLVLSAFVLSPIGSVAGPSAAPVPQGLAPVTPKIPRGAIQVGTGKELADHLRRQGRDPRLYLIWKGSPLQFAYRDRIEVGGARFDIVALEQAFVAASGDWVERYVLLDETGTVQDVATLYWPTRHRFEIRAFRSSKEAPKIYLEIHDSMFQRRPGPLAIPCVELGIEPRTSKTVSFPSTETSGVAEVWIEKGRFKAVPARN
jgi:hypothetical protein